jgi:hypothetical protein
MIMTFEDDVKFTSPNSRKRFEEVYQTLPEDWDVFLGGIYMWDKTLIINDSLTKCRDFSGLAFPNKGDRHPGAEQHKKFTNDIIIPFLQEKNYI